VTEAAAMTDHLTQLGNQRALDNWLEYMIAADDETFSLAFIEVDHFKRINDKFQYANADRLLMAIGALLSDAQTTHANSIGFRAHGDEFYFGMTHDSTPFDGFHNIVDGFRASIAGIRIDTNGESMSCTVSVGWWTPALLDAGASYDALYVLDRLQRTVDEAKRKRNRTLKYDAAFDSRRLTSTRVACGACEIKVSMDFDPATHSELTVTCPSCAAPMA
jgi:diguanylate cyclase (GGDEF)-like protein